MSAPLSTDRNTSIAIRPRNPVRPRNAASLPKRLRTNTVELLLHFRRQTGNIRKLEFRRDVPALRVFQPINLALLLRNVAGILGLGFNRRYYTVQRLFTQAL